MATYKVIQDIEAEDKILGPLTLRQFIYAGIVAVSLFVMFKLVFIKWFLILPLVPHTLLFAVLAAPIGKDQTPEVWLLAKIRFILKPQKRIWDQSGLKELVTITVPKKVEQQLTDGLSQTEVRSRLQALANTIDSRGWAVKNVNVNLFAQPSYVLDQVGSDRLIDPRTIPQDVPSYDTQSIQDVLDENTSPTAQAFNNLIQQSQTQHKQQIMAKMQQAGASTPADYWFMNGAPAPSNGKAAFAAPGVVAPGAADPTSAKPISKAEEEALLKKIHLEDNRPKAYGHTKVLDPKGVSTKLSKKKHEEKETKPTPTPVDPAILELASRDDLNVATIARQAEKSRPKDPPDEVVISLR